MTQVTADWLKSEGTQSLFRLFSEAGYQLYSVGGCVRNTLLNRPVADIDMATDATPDQVIAIAKTKNLKFIPTGLQHGTVTLVVGDVPFEITTFRTDLQTDGRHATVVYSNSLEEDAKRRDFTMNALYADAEGVVCDTVGGLIDMESKTIRFIGNPADRIQEDYLRILRFFRFYAWYGTPESGIDVDGLAACSEHAEGIETLSRERVGAEMRKLLAAPDPAPAIASMAQSGVLLRVMPGANPAALAVLVHLEAELPSDWKRRALVLGGEDITDHWRLSKAEARDLSQASTDLAAQTSVAEMAYRHGPSHARNVALVMAASLQQPPSSDLEQQITTASEAVFPVQAEDLMPTYAGAALGQKLAMLEAEWISSGFSMTRDALLQD